MDIQTGTLEGVAVNVQFWRGKRVLITGHTGFKGSWLSLWLRKLGATVAGYALPPETGESLFKLAQVAEDVDSTYGDIRNPTDLSAVFERFRPDIVFHLAAQALVRRSYLQPIETYEVNVMGTAHLFEAVRKCKSCRVVVNVTSDKCYENKEWEWGYRECDPMGGYDPYSSSKGCAELVTAAYRRSFFQTQDAKPVGTASARAGNVIGGGDFSKDRIIPDIIAAIKSGGPLYVRNPDAIRPWQHVLEPLSGYLLLAEKLWNEPRAYGEGWNFGPAPDDVRPVRWIVEKLNEYLEEPVAWQIVTLPKPHEAQLLTLDSTKARAKLGWNPRWTLEVALQAIADWHKAYGRGERLRDVTMQQIARYEEAAQSTSHASRSSAASTAEVANWSTVGLS